MDDGFVYNIFFLFSPLTATFPHEAPLFTGRIFVSSLFHGKRGGLHYIFYIIFQSLRIFCAIITPATIPANKVNRHIRTNERIDK